MTFFLVLIAITFGIGYILKFTKIDFHKKKEVVKKASLFSLAAFLICIILLTYDFRLKGRFTMSIIGFTFVISTFLFLILTKNNLYKLLKSILILPLLVLAVLFLLFQHPIEKFDIGENRKIEIRDIGFLSCGETLELTESKLWILDKLLFVDKNLCLLGIYKIEKNKIDENHLELLIFHNEKMDSENPYKYQMEIKNVW